jgi:mRNA interferase MazF
MNRPIRKTELLPGRVIWVEFGETVGREQSGTRPAIVVSSRQYSSTFDGLVMVVPVTSRSRGWTSHVEVVLNSGQQTRTSWAITEQVKAISTARIRAVHGFIEPEALAEIHTWTKTHLGFVPKV